MKKFYENKKFDSFSLTNSGLCFELRLWDCMCVAWKTINVCCVLVLSIFFQLFHLFSLRDVYEEILLITGYV